MNKKKAIIYTILTIYLIAWIFGSPRVINHNTNKVLTLYRSISIEYPDHPKKFVPSLDFSFILPILPLVLISNHGYRVGNVGAADGIWLYIWYGKGVYEVPLLVRMA